MRIRFFPFLRGKLGGPPPLPDESLKFANWAVELRKRDPDAFRRNRTTGRIAETARLKKNLTREQLARRLGPPFTVPIILAIETSNDLRRLREEEDADVGRLMAKLGLGDQHWYRKVCEEAQTNLLAEEEGDSYPD